MRSLVAGLLLILGATAGGVEEPARVRDVRAAGATGDGKTLDRAAIQGVIDGVAAAGGGVVAVPAGTYLTGALTLRSGIVLRLAKGAVLQACSDASQFPVVRGRWEGEEMDLPSPLLWADSANGLVIEGEGEINGDDRAMVLKSCRDARVSGVTFRCKRRWTVQILYCDGVVVDNCRFDTAGNNTDGCDPDSSRNVTISRCRFSTGDDCISVKSGKNADGRRVGRPCEDIRISDCIMERGHAMVAIGSEMSGDIRRVTIERCRATGTDSGLRLKTRRGRGGTIEDITLDDCDFTGVGQALWIDTLYKYNAGRNPVPGPEGIPTLRRITVRNLRGTDIGIACSLTGMKEHPIEALTLAKWNLVAKAAGTISDVRDAVFTDLVITAPTPLVATRVTGTGVPAGPVP